ncbi:MAG: hypothetical protein ACKO24_04415 [Leptolyngbyaceae cyanobacterium]
MAQGNLTLYENVYSTVNIQHLESLNDLFARITGVVVINGTSPPRFEH